MTPKTFLAFLFLLTLAVPAGWPQGGQGSIVGTVTDDSGAVIPKAKLTATNERTAAERSVEADENGKYEIGRAHV